jgi:hypothetical protein
MLNREAALMFPIVCKLGNGEYHHESLAWTLQAAPEAPAVIREPGAR